MVSSYYRGAHAIIILFDYTNINSFYSIKNWLKEIKLFAKENTIKYLVCNKIDNNNSYDNTTSNSSSWQLNEDVIIPFLQTDLFRMQKISQNKIT
jgi:Ras-related protein Rab-1A